MEVRRSQLSDEEGKESRFSQIETYHSPGVACRSRFTQTPVKVSLEVQRLIEELHIPAVSLRLPNWTATARQV
ncbi:hypothetical protein PAMP_004107 [Pampus punctatissimus]